MTRHMRRVVVIGAAFIAAVELVMGSVAYGTTTWNWDHTKVLTHWGAVREVCLIFVPVTALVITTAACLVVAALTWAVRDRRP